MASEESKPPCCRKGGTNSNEAPPSWQPNARSSLSPEGEIREHNPDQTQAELDLSSVHESSEDALPIPPPRYTYGRSGSYTEEIDENKPSCCRRISVAKPLPPPPQTSPPRPKTTTPSRPKSPGRDSQKPKMACCKDSSASGRRKILDTLINEPPPQPRQHAYERPKSHQEHEKAAKILSGSYVEEMDRYEPLSADYSKVQPSKGRQDHTSPKTAQPRRYQYETTAAEYDPLPPPKKTRVMSRSFYEEQIREHLARRAAPALPPPIPKNYAPPQYQSKDSRGSRSYRDQTPQRNRYQYEPARTDYNALPPPEQTRGMSSSFYEDKLREHYARRPSPPPSQLPKTSLNRSRISPKTHVPPSSRNYSTYDHPGSEDDEYSYISEIRESPEVETLYMQNSRSPQRTPRPTNQMQHPVREDQWSQPPLHRTPIARSRPPSPRSVRSPSPRRQQQWSTREQAHYADITERSHNQVPVPRIPRERPNNRSPSPHRLKPPWQTQEQVDYANVTRRSYDQTPVARIPKGRATPRPIRSPTPQQRPQTPQQSRDTRRYGDYTQGSTRAWSPQRSRPVQEYEDYRRPITAEATPRRAWTSQMQRPQSALSPAYPPLGLDRPRTADAALARVTESEHEEYNTYRVQYPEQYEKDGVGAENFETLLEIKTPRTLDSNNPMHLSINITCPRGFTVNGSDKRYVEYNPNLQSYSVPP